MSVWPFALVLDLLHDGTSLDLNNCFSIVLFFDILNGQWKWSQFYHICIVCTWATKKVHWSNLSQTRSTEIVWALFSFWGLIIITLWTLSKYQTWMAFLSWSNWMPYSAETISWVSITRQVTSDLLGGEFIMRLPKGEYYRGQAITWENSLPDPPAMP